MKDKPTSFRSFLAPTLFLALIFFVNFLARIILAPLMPTMENDLGLSHAEAGSLFLWITIGYLITLPCSGFFSARWTHRWAIIVSASAVGMALLGISFTGSARTLGIALFLLGMSTGLYFPSGIATLTSLIPPRHWGKGMAIHELGPNLAFVIGPLICEALLGWTSWQGVLAMMGGASLILGLGFFRFGKGGEFPGQAPSPASFSPLFRDPSCWLMMVLYGLGISGSLGVYTMLPLTLVTEHGMDRNWANTLVALSRISGVAMVFLAGWATDRLGARKTLFGVFLLTGLSTVGLGAASGLWVVFLVFLQPALAACFFPPGLAALSSIGSPQVRNVTVSLTIPLSFLFGGGAVPTFIGMMGDAGSFSMGIGIVGGLILMGASLSLLLKPPQR
ncbi:MAG: MFS transporter [Deltaproteobacteria bacterium]|nr:MFS transporter [Deltaproteobacteria bacterium]